MEHMSSVFSLLFFSLIVIYLYWGIYVIKLNKNAMINKVFLAMTISMAIWSLGFAMSNTADTAEQALLWRRISAIGWSTIYSLMLHFMILLSHKDLNLKYRKLLGFIYIPAIINLYIFAFSNRLALIQYNLIKIDFGWTNRSINNGLDLFFKTYYISYILLSILIVWSWQRSLEDRKIAKQARLIVYGLMASSFLGIITDVVMTSLLNNPLPQLAPLFILLPTGAMYYSTKYHGFIKTKHTFKNEIIITGYEKKRVFEHIGIAFFMGGILSFLFRSTTILFNAEGNWERALFRSFIFLVLGTAILIVQKIKDEYRRELLTIIALLISIPLIILQFLEYSSVTVWAFPVIILISSIIFSKLTLLISTTLVTLITQRLVWILRPDTLVQVDGYHFILRMAFFILAFFIGLYINRIYIAKIKENESQIKFQKMNAKLSVDFLTINEENFNEKMNDLLSEVGSFFEIDRAYLSFTDNATITYFQEWCNLGIESVPKTSEMQSFTDFPFLMEKMASDKILYYEDIEDMPIEASLEQAYFHYGKVKSILAIPIILEDKIEGFIAMFGIRSHQKWSEEKIELTRIISSLISNGLNKVRSEKEINFRAYYDNLTKLPNRLLFSDRVDQAINLAKRNEKFLSIVFLDLDNFKSVNDTIGHRGGDDLLKKVADGLTKLTRESDTVSRFGGDEFMVLLNNIDDHKDISKVADKIMGLFEKPLNINGQDFSITASAGISIYPVDGENAEELIKNADTAMYKAKDKGKNQYAMCTYDMKEEVKLSMTLSNDLHRAVERNELEVYYQPQIDLNTGKINGLEALIRWIHPEKGMISPGIFITLAEKNGTINKIGEWVLKTACLQNKKWQDMGLIKLKVAVNLSAIQFINPNIAEDVAGILRETELDPKYLELEITESIAIKEVSYVEEVLNKLKSIGISIAIDDFGTEYSSLSRLRTLPIDRIKIDMQFTQGIEANKKDRAITMVIINLAKSLGLNVIAEGVETRPQRDFLNQKLCDDVQGYFYYRPMPVKEIEKILADFKK